MKTSFWCSSVLLNWGNSRGPNGSWHYHNQGCPLSANTDAWKIQPSIAFPLNSLQVLYIPQVRATTVSQLQKYHIMWWCFPFNVTVWILDIDKQRCCYACKIAKITLYLNALFRHVFNIHGTFWHWIRHDDTSVCIYSHSNWALS